MQKLQRLFIIALFGSIIFVTNVFLPSPLNYLIIVVQAVLLALSGLFIPKVGARIMQEMTKRGVITRARLEHIFFSPALVITEEQLDRMVSVTQEAVKAVTGK